MAADERTRGGSAGGNPGGGAPPNTAGAGGRVVGMLPASPLPGEPEPRQGPSPRPLGARRAGVAVLSARGGRAATPCARRQRSGVLAVAGPHRPASVSRSGRATGWPGSSLEERVSGAAKRLALRLSDSARGLRLPARATRPACAAASRPSPATVSVSLTSPRHFPSGDTGSRGRRGNRHVRLPPPGRLLRLGAVRRRPGRRSPARVRAALFPPTPTGGTALLAAGLPPSWRTLSAAATFPGLLGTRLPQGDIAALEKRGHVSFGLTKNSRSGGPNMCKRCPRTGVNYVSGLYTRGRGKRRRGALFSLSLRERVGVRVKSGANEYSGRSRNILAKAEASGRPCPAKAGETTSFTNLERRRIPPLA